MKFEKTGENLFTVTINGQTIGKIGDTSLLEEYIADARKEIAKRQEELVFIDTEVTTQGEEVLWGKVDSESVLRENILRVLNASVIQTMQRSYTVKVNEFTVNLSSIDEVQKLLQAAIDKYATQDKFEVTLLQNSSREFNVLTTKITKKQEEKEAKTVLAENQALPECGVIATLTDIFTSVEPAREKDWDDFELGLVDMEFGDEIEVVESYLPDYKLTSLEAATERVTKDQEKNQIYEVVSGDTLLGISLKTSIPMEKLIEMNDSLESENSIIHIGDELIITIPEPELSVERQEEAYYEEEYDEEIIYIDNDEWYTTQTKTLQEPSAGFRKVVALISYRNDTEVGREIEKEEVVMAAVPKIVERGTIVPPTYIKPISGGRLSSSFGRRKAPKRGDSSYHKGIDWATPVGTTVVASSSGTVAKAGWGSGYGYVVYINHPDGKQTRYGHLSKVLVSSGQTVTQGQRIALSGNTGVSTGPHIHFEILVNGSQVNPLNYLN